MKKTATAVKGLTKIIDGVRQYENFEHQEYLLDENGKGKTPPSVEIERLIASGHPNRSLAELREAFSYNAAGVPDRKEIPNHITSYKKITEHCVGCSGSRNEAKDCSIINCPFWAYRTGNPYSKKLGNTNGLNTQFQAQKHGETPCETDKVYYLGVTLPEASIYELS